MGQCGTWRRAYAFAMLLHIYRFGFTSIYAVTKQQFAGAPFILNQRLSRLKFLNNQKILNQRSRLRIQSGPGGGHLRRFGAENRFPRSTGFSGWPPSNLFLAGTGCDRSHADAAAVVRRDSTKNPDPRRHAWLPSNTRRNQRINRRFRQSIAAQSYNSSYSRVTFERQVGLSLAFTTTARV